jgi:hypothetical protein
MNKLGEGTPEINRSSQTNVRGNQARTDAKSSKINEAADKTAGLSPTGKPIEHEDVIPTKHPNPTTAGAPEIPVEKMEEGAVKSRKNRPRATATLDISKAEDQAASVKAKLQHFKSSVEIFNMTFKEKDAPGNKSYLLSSAETLSSMIKQNPAFKNELPKDFEQKVNLVKKEMEEIGGTEVDKKNQKIQKNVSDFLQSVKFSGYFVKRKEVLLEFFTAKNNNEGQKALELWGKLMPSTFVEREEYQKNPENNIQLMKQEKDIIELLSQGKYKFFDEQK